ncbi:xanthine dehydrogenase family protein molybdopterin-binding subunit [Hansschlegelia beijingensis]|uniref:CO/xanthine dehydrogenase Mo-binding subunit n=1 Tax=Hansschlegelia beijingensis TaxID=1133344 RepID=A0A7W6GE32_9HYPH|nr:molybdopterin cofactor-binding domain-containing protein [Hansschlegelia beijingensis]MBB3971643.1 CO/xanthine dehydrogenase Mo-binding subunit [Hansschlegelia beijingensis]
MTLPIPDVAQPSRRALLQTGGGFALAFFLGVGSARATISARPQPGDAELAAREGATFAPNALIRIDREGPVRLVMPNVEMGQGVYTTEAMLLAEELDVGLDQVIVQHAPPIDALYGTPLLKSQTTGGSTTVRANWMILREAGAVARAMLISAAAEQWGVPAAECVTKAGVVKHAASGRSATYNELAEAAARQQTPEKVGLKDPKDFKLVGKPMRRIDSPSKVDGSAIFGIDIRVPDMQVAYVITCPTAGGTLKSVKEDEARKQPGVKDVIRLPHGVAVTAPNYWAAKKAAEALEIEWDHGPNVDFSTEGLFKALDEASRTGKALVARSDGPLDRKGKTIEAVYQHPILAHAPMEPLNAVVHVRPDACEIWVGSQVPTRAVGAAAKLTGLPEDKIILHNQYLGGGFGRRLEVDSVELAVNIAKQVPYPVKMIWSREHDIRHDIPRTAYLDRVSAVVDDEGYPVVWKDRTCGASVPKRWAPQMLRKDGFDADLTECSDELSYDIPAFHVEWVPHDMPEAIPIGWWRGVGPTHNIFKVEGFVDELAHAAGKDPVEFRRKMLTKNPRPLSVLNKAAEAIGWGEKLPPRVGRGVAFASPFGSHVCAIAEVEVSPRGVIRIRRGVAAIDCGPVMNPNTVEAQIQGGLIFGWTMALFNEITFEKGAVKQSNFHDYRMMRLNETPPIEVHIVKNEGPIGGMGEVGTAIAAPALANAVFAATGVRLRRLPLDPRLLADPKAGAA